MAGRARPFKSSSREDDSAPPMICFALGSGALSEGHNLSYSVMSWDDASHPVTPIPLRPCPHPVIQGLLAQSVPFNPTETPRIECSLVSGSAHLGRDRHRASWSNSEQQLAPRMAEHDPRRG